MTVTDWIVGVGCIVFLVVLLVGFLLGPWIFADDDETAAGGER